MFLGSIFLFHTCCANVVDVCLSSLLKECLCAVYLVLNEVEVLPMYVVVVLLCSAVALYITFSVRHLLLTGHKF